MMIVNEIHVVQHHPPINWCLLKNDLTTGRINNKTLERYSLDYIYPLISCNYRAIDSLSRVFSRIISNELQSSNILRKTSFFASSRLSEKLYKIDACSSSRQIYQTLIDLWSKSDNEFESISSNIARNDIKNSHKNTDLLLHSQFNNSFINILRNIIKKCGDVNKSITIWSIIPENNMEFKSAFESIEDDTISVKIIQGLLNICFNDLQREFFNLRNVKINLVLIIKYSKTLLSLSNDKIPIIVTNNSNYQINISCLDSRCLLSYSDVIIANSLNLVTLRLELSNSLFESSTNLTFFAEKSNYLSNFVESSTCNNEHSDRKIDSLDLSDSEEGEVVEQENIITIMEDEFQKKGWIKLVDNITMKVVGFIPHHWSPTAIKLLPLTSPVGKNSFKLLKEVYFSLHFGSILLGINDIPLAALVINLPIIKNRNYDQFISKNVFNRQISETKYSFDNEHINTTLKRNLFNLVIINRKPIIPLPISRKFQCENKLNMMINIDVSKLDDKYILFASSKFQELFHKIKASVDLKIQINKNTMIDLHNSNEKDKYPDNILVKKLYFSQEICNSIKVTMTVIPSLLMVFDYLISTHLKSQGGIINFNSYTPNLEDEKEHFESKFCIPKSRLIDLSFPNINGIDRKHVFKSFLNIKLKDYQSNKTTDSQVVISKIDNYFSLLLGELPMSGCLFCYNGISSEVIASIISDREFVMQNVPKLFWLSICYLINSMKFISKEHQRLFYLINHGKDIEPAIHLEIPCLKSDLFQVGGLTGPSNQSNYFRQTEMKIDNLSRFDSVIYFKRLNFE